MEIRCSYRLVVSLGILGIHNLNRLKGTRFVCHHSLDCQMVYSFAEGVLVTPNKQLVVGGP